MTLITKLMSQFTKSNDLAVITNNQSVAYAELQTLVAIKSAVNKKLLYNFKIDKTDSVLLHKKNCVETVEPELVQTALLPLTSGSTGEPKLLKISLAALIYLIKLISKIHTTTRH